MKGDILRIGSRQHPRVVTLPSLDLTLQSGKREVRFHGPRNASVVLSVTRADGHTTVNYLTTDRQGSGMASIPNGPLSLGDTATVRIESTTGDQIYARGQARGILVREGSGSVSGTVRPGDILSIHALSAAGVELGGVVVAADRQNGNFRARLVTRTGKPVSISAGMQLLVRDGTLVTSTTVPVLRIARKGTSITSVAAIAPGQTAKWTGTGATGGSTVRPLRANSHGTAVDHYSIAKSANLRRVVLSAQMGQGVTVETVLQLGKRHRGRARVGTEGRKAIVCQHW